MILEEALDRAAESLGVELPLHRDALPVESRTVKVFSELIQHIRKVEARVLRELRGHLEKAEREANESLKKVGELQAALYEKDAQLRALRLKDRMDEIAALKPADRARLLEVTS